MSLLEYPNLVMQRNTWDVLKVTPEGISDIKRARKDSLIQEYEIFRLQLEETIVGVRKKICTYCKSSHWYRKRLRQGITKH